VLDRLVLKNFILYGMYQAMRLGFPLVATPFLAHVLARDTFSDFAVLNSCIWTSTVFMEFGFYLYGVSRTAAADGKAELAEVVSSIATAKLLLAPLALAVYAALAVSTGVAAREPAATMLGLVGALGYGASFAWYFQGRQRGLTAVLTEAAPQMVQFALLLSLVRSPHDLWLVFALQAIPPLASLTYALVSVRREGLIGKVSWDRLAATLKGAAPFFVERFCYSTYTAVMPSLILLLSTKAEVAYYSIGDRFGTLIVTMSAPLAQAAMPRMAKAVGGPDGGWRLSLRLVALQVTAITTFAGLIFAVTGVVIGKFFSADFAPAVGVARTFCVTACFAGGGFALSKFVLIPRDRARVMIWSSSTALVLGLAAQFVLTPRWGAQGAAFGRLISEATVALVLTAAAVRLHQAEQRRQPRASTSASAATTRSTSSSTIPG